MSKERITNPQRRAHKDIYRCSPPPDQTKNPLLLSTTQISLFTMVDVMFPQQHYVPAQQREHRHHHHEPHNHQQHQHHQTMSAQSHAMSYNLQQQYQHHHEMVVDKYRNKFQQKKERDQYLIRANFEARNNNHGSAAVKHQPRSPLSPADNEAVSALQQTRKTVRFTSPVRNVCKALT